MCIELDIYYKLVIGIRIIGTVYLRFVPDKSLPYTFLFVIVIDNTGRLLKIKFI